MVWPHNEAVANATHKKGKRKSSSSSSGAKKRKKTTTSTSTSTASRSGTGSNDHVPLQVLPPVLPAASAHTALTPMKKCGVTKKLTPKRAPVQVDSPASPAAANTRSKKKLKLE
ncbi:hypothetical protein PVAP13_2KG298347 [Panicum virgatum]|uniref:Uncharacterized protein n=1 Tax=Panicum virgatum TaxID=38727 RepID=A0A8T0WI15_PANVG|nr:hypothetical protein PVAP13_2KG298347 [Panicum virgatum]